MVANLGADLPRWTLSGTVALARHRTRKRGMHPQRRAHEVGKTLRGKWYLQRLIGVGEWRSFMRRGNGHEADLK